MQVSLPSKRSHDVNETQHPDDEPGPSSRLTWSPKPRTVTVVLCHAAGEIGHVVIDGAEVPAGASVIERQTRLRRDDRLRRFLLKEPRGSVAAHANLLVPSARDDCVAGFIIMEPTEYPMMSGSNTMCVATVLLETGVIPMQEPVTRFRLEAPGGVVDVRAACSGGRCTAVELDNVPSFVAELDAPLEVPGIGSIAVDVAYGGMWYAIASAEALGFELVPDEARDLSAVGERIRVAAREQLTCRHPALPTASGVSIVQIAQEWQGIGAVTKNAVVVAPGRLDRSGTGTGLSARMAVLHARGLMSVGDEMAHASVIGSVFQGRIVRETAVGTTAAIIPAIRGRAWITGVAEYFVDPDDPFPTGYSIADTWPGPDTQA